MRVAVLVVLVLVGAATVVTRYAIGESSLAARAASSATAAPSGKLVFAASRDEGGATLVVVNGDGTGRRRLTDVPLDDPRAVWSPDGTTIAVSEALFGPLLLVTADGRSQRRLAVDAQSPIWSPDGRRIAFARSLDVYVVNTAAHPRPTRLGTAAPGGGWLIAWSPDARRLAFGTRDGITLVDVRTGARETLQTSRRNPGRLAWSPDGRTLAFVSGEMLSLIGADGRDERAVIGGLGDYEDSTPSWSPDGSRILFARSVYQAWSGVFSVGADGRGLRQLIRTRNGFISSPTWSPDGRHVAFSWTRFSEFDPYGSDVLVIDANGGDARPLTTAAPDDLDYGAPSWTAGNVPRTAPKPRRGWPGLTASKLVVANGLVETLAAGESLVAFTRRRTDEGSCILTTANQGLGARRHSAISEGSGSCVERLVVSATRLYWMVWYEEGHSIDADELWTKREAGRPQSIWQVNRPDSSPIYGGNLHGDSSVVVYNTWFQAARDVKAARLWRLEGQKRAGVDAGARSFPVVAAGGGRIAVLDRPNVIVIFDANGHAVQRLELQPGRLLGTEIGGGRLVALRPDRLEAYDLGTGKLARVRAVTPAPTPRLHDADGDLVVYSRGLELTVLSLSSGRRAIVELPDHAGPIGAALTTAGLYYAYNVPRAASPGRVGFVSRGRLTARVG